MFFPEGQVRVHLYGQPADMRNYAELCVMRSWTRWRPHHEGEAAELTPHNHEVFGVRSEAMRLSGARKRPRRKVGGNKAPIASSFAVGSART